MILACENKVVKSLETPRYWPEYQGLQKIHPKTILPHKRRRKCALTSKQKAHNTMLASERIVVEHVFARIKKFKILGSIYRSSLKKLNLRFNIIADNLKFS